MQLVFILVLLGQHASMVRAVNDCHSDRDKDHRPRVTCAEAGFSSIPPDLDPTTKVLAFPRNQFSALSWSSYLIFSEIHEIDLTDNKVPEVTPSAAAILPTLNVLRLGKNLLTSLPDGSFSACPGLTELYLDNNAIAFLGNETFSGLGKLEILDLSSNRITLLPVSMLRPLPAIETLYLEINQITDMPVDWFVHKEDVPYLYLSANPWACFCSLGYLYGYLDEYSLNIYVRDGPVVSNDVNSVVCASPSHLKGQPVMELEESDFCVPDQVVRGDGRLPVAATSPAPLQTARTDPATIAPTAVTTGVSDVLSNEVTAAVVIEVATEVATEVVTEVVIEMATKVHIEVATEVAPGATEVVANVATEAATEFVSEVATLDVTYSPPEVTTGDREVTLALPPPPGWWAGLTGGGRRQWPCVWLFASYLLLCLFSGALALGTLCRLLAWYRVGYGPLRAAPARRGRRGVASPNPGVTALYRSVLFISRDWSAEHQAGGGQGSPPGPVQVQYRTSVLLLGPARLGGGVSRMRYSVILREEREGGRDWRVGGWEGPPSHLPSMLRVEGGGEEELL